MGGAARPLHDPGNHRSIERGSNPYAARCGSLRRPAKPAGERHIDAALTPPPGTRSERPYLFGRAVMANPSNPSMTVPANCVWKEQDPTPPACWPADQPVLIDFDGGRILNV